MLARKPPVRRGDKAPLHGERDLVLAARARGHDEDAARAGIAGDGQVRLGAEQVPQLRRQRALRVARGMRAGQHQRVELQHRVARRVLPGLRGEHLRDARVQRADALALRALGQCHLQDVPARVRGEPGLQLRIHPVHQFRPGAAVHRPAFLGGDGLAADLRHRAVAAHKQVVGRAVQQPVVAELEAPRAEQRGDAQQVEKRHERAVAVEADEPAQPLARRLRHQRLGEQCRLPREGEHAPLGPAGLGQQLRAREPGEDQLEGMTLLRGAGLQRTGLDARGEVGDAGLPTLRARKRHKGAHRGVVRRCVAQGHGHSGALMTDGCPGSGAFVNQCYKRGRSPAREVSAPWQRGAAARGRDSRPDPAGGRRRGDWGVSSARPNSRWAGEDRSGRGGCAAASGAEFRFGLTRAAGAPPPARAGFARGDAARGRPARWRSSPRPPARPGCRRRGRAGPWSADPCPRRPASRPVAA